MHFFKVLHNGRAYLSGDENVAIAGTKRSVRFLLFLRSDFFRICRHTHKRYVFSKQIVIIISRGGPTSFSFFVVFDLRLQMCARATRKRATGTVDKTENFPRFSDPGTTGETADVFRAGRIDEHDLCADDVTTRVACQRAAVLPSCVQRRQQRVPGRKRLMSDGR